VRYPIDLALLGREDDFPVEPYARSGYKIRRSRVFETLL